MYTDLLDVLRHFTGQNELHSAIPLKSGLINNTWKVVTGSNKYIVQQINTQVFKNPEYIDHNSRIIRHFLDHHHADYFIPLPLLDAQGTTLYRHQSGKCFRMQPYVADSRTLTKAGNTKQAFEAAITFGGLSARLHDLAPTQLKSPIIDFHNLTLRYEQFKNSLKEAAPNRLELAETTSKAINEHLHLLEKFNSFSNHSSFRLRIMHHDTKISNILFNQQDEGICAIDLDTLMPGYLWSDIGDMVRTFACSVSEEEQDISKVIVRTDILHAIYDGYKTAMHPFLTDFETKAIPIFGCIMTYMQALRFLTDYLRNDVYYGASYPDHNLRRAQNQIKLLTELDC